MDRDSLMEIRSMVMASLPCLPLPMMVNKELFDEGGHLETVDHVTSSHDLIAHLIQKSLHVKNEAFYTLKEIAQASAIKSLNQAMDELIQRGVYPFENQANQENQEASTQMLYEVFQKFTRDYIQAFLPKDKYIDVRFKPYKDVVNEDSILTRARDFARAQDILYGAKNNPFNIDIMTYEQAIQLSGLRFLD